MKPALDTTALVAILGFITTLALTAPSTGTGAVILAAGLYGAVRFIDWIFNSL